MLAIETEEITDFSRNNDLRSISASNSTVKSVSYNMKPESSGTTFGKQNQDNKDSENSVIFESTVTMDIDDLQAEESIQLPLRSKPIWSLMKFQKHTSSFGQYHRNCKKIAETKTQHIESRKLNSKEIHNEIPQSERSEYVYTNDVESSPKCCTHQLKFSESKSAVKGRLVTETVFKRLGNQKASQSPQKNNAWNKSANIRQSINNLKEVNERKDPNSSIADWNEHSSLNILNISDDRVELKNSPLNHQSTNKVQCGNKITYFISENLSKTKIY